MNKANKSMCYLVLTDKIELPIGYEKYIITDASCINAISWCKEHHVDYFVLPENWENSDSYIRDLQYLEKIQQKLVSYLSQELNNYHDISFSYDQWYIMLGQWSVNYLSVLYDKYLKLKKICNLQIRCKCDLYSVDNVDIPLDYIEFYEWIQDEKFHLFLYTLLYSNMEEAQKWIVSDTYIPYSKSRIELKKCEVYGKKAKLFRGLFRANKKMTGKLDSIAITDAYHYLPLSVKVQSVLLGLGSVSIYENHYNRARYLFDAEINLQWRNGIDHVCTKDEFLNIAYILVKKFLPSVCVENFDKLLSLMKNEYQYALQANKIIYDYSGMTSNEIHKAYLMIMKGKGAKLYDMQHGGSYGIDYDFHHDTEYKICDVFYSWGWHLENKLCDFQPMPIQKIIGRNKCERANCKRILYLGYARPKNILSLQEYSINADIEKVGEVEFFRSLSLKVKENLVVRLYKRNFGWWNTEESLERNVGGLKFDSGAHNSANLNKNYYEAVMSSRLLVAPVLSTTALEALALGVPILVKHKLEGIESEAYADLLELKRVGVLVESWDQFGLSLEQIYDSVEVWWNEPQRKEVIETFKKKYALTAKNARKIWLEKILEV